MKKITYLLMFMLFSFLGVAQTVTIGTGTSVQVYPLGNYYGFERSASIYTAAEVTSTGSITKLGWNANVASSTSRPIKIYLKTTTSATLTASTWASQTTGATLVYDSSVAITAGWNDFVLTTPFAYTGGTNNLLVLVEANYGGFGTGAVTGGSVRYSAATGKHMFVRGDSTAPTGNGSVTANRPNIQISFPSATVPNCAISHLPADLATGVVKNPTLSWADGGGGPTSYDVYFGTTTSPALVGNQAGSTYTPSVLADNTQYFWRVVPKNANGDAVGGCVERSFTTGTGFNYCTPIYVNGCSFGGTIGSVSTTSATTNISNLSTGCTSLNATGYNDYSSTIQMSAAQSTSFNIEVGVANYGSGVKVWIDYNQNGTFETGEIVAASTSTIASGSSFNGLISIPNTALLGNTRMRVRIVEGSTSFDACSSQSYGETEDYMINILTPPSCAAPTALTAANVTGNSVDVSWAASVSSPLVGYEYAVTTSATPPASGTAVSGTSASVSTLSPSTTYYLHVRSECIAGSGYSAWASSASFTTTQIAATLPYTQDFTAANGFDFVNGTQVNQWAYGSAAGNTGNSIYISNDSGVTNAYNNSSISTVQAYRDIAIPSGTTLTSLSFDWLANGESGWDYLRVWLVPSSFTPVAGTQIAAGTGRIQLGGNLGIQTTWQTYSNATLDLSSFANSTMRLVFEWRNDGSGGTQTPGAIDNISLSIPSCLSPTALTASNITTTTVDLGWTASTSAPANGYDYYYSTTNTAPTTTVSGNVNAITTTITSLTPSTTYYYWVRSNCGTSDFSDWTAGGSFTTLCDAVTAFPWTENFETVTTPALPNCWSANDANADNDKWITYSGNGVGSSIAAGLYTDGNSGANDDYLILPRMTLTGNQRVKFFVRARSTGEPNDYRVVLSTTGNQPSDFTNVIMPLTTVSSTTMTEISAIDLSAYSGDVYIAIHVPAAGLDGWYLYVDNFTVENIPTCIVPTAPITANVTATSVDVSWTATTSTPLVGYEYAVTTSATPPASGTAVSGTSATVSTLSASTTYYLHVRSECIAGNDYSAWITSAAFTTPCNSISSFPWTENFDAMTTLGANIVPNCWSTQGATAFTSANAASQTYNDPRSGANYITRYYGTAASYLWSPGMELTAGQSYDYTFYFVGDGYSGWTGDVVQNTTASATGETVLGSSFVVTGTTTSGTSYTKVTRSFIPSANGVYYFGVKVLSNFSPYYLGFDDFSLDLSPNCLAPTGLTVTNITAASADISWTATTSSPLVGYEYAVTNSATPPASGTAVTGTSATVSTLSASTTYYLHVRSECIAGNDYSAWVTSAAFTTSCASVSTFPYLESFEGITSGVPNCWATAGTTTNAAYNFSSYATGQTGRGLRFDSYVNPNGLTGELTTPTFDLSSLAAAQFKFNFKNPTGGNFQVLISSDGGITYTSLENNLISQTTWLEKTYDISSFISTQVIIKFIGTSNYGPSLAYIDLDEISIEQPLCLSTATWDGSTWTGTPSATAALVFNGNFTSATTVDGCSATINGTSAVTFTAGTLNLQNHLVIAAGASLVLESGANLVQVNSTEPNNVLGTFTAKRNSANIIRLDYTNWSSPVVGQNALAFSPATLTNRFYSYDPSGTTTAGATGSYVAIDPATTNFTSGKGLLVRAPNTWSDSTPSAYPGQFTGVPNNGNYSVAVVNNPANTTSTPASIGFNLLGNPYASPISANDFLTANSGAGINTLYFWTHTLAASGGSYATSNYAVYNNLGGTAAAAAGGATPDGIIQVGQGFLANTATGGSAVFNNSMRLATSNGQFFKTSGQINQPTTVEKHRMWFDLNSPGNNHNQILVGYIDGATNGLDATFDANIFEETTSVLYSALNNAKYAIQGRALPFASSDIVPLGMVAETAGQYTITMSSFDGMFTSQDVFLRDNMLNITHDIKTTPYTFASAAGQFDSRFEIVYAAPLSVQTPTFTENSVVVYSNQSGININAGQTIIDNVKVFDVRGRLLVSKSKVNATSISIENVTTEKQVLIVQITSSDNVTVSKKVIN